MPALAMGVGFIGYSVSFWGYCLLRAYNVTFWSVMSPLRPPSWASIRGSQIPPGQIFPSGAPRAAAEGGGVPPGKPPAASEGGGVQVISTPQGARGRPQA